MIDYAHILAISGHSEAKPIYNRMGWFYNWPNMANDISNYVE